MIPSDELKNAMQRLYESMTSGDVSAVAHQLSHQSGVLSIGTDPNEWWEGYDAIARVVKAQLEEMGGIQVKAGNLNAFVEGNVGWAADCPIVRLPNGQEMTLRWTTVFHIEDGEWKIVQRHVSLGVSNVEAIGKEVTTR